MKPWGKAQRATWKPDVLPSEKYGHRDNDMSCSCWLCSHWNVGMELKPFTVQRKEVFGS